MAEARVLEILNGLFAATQNSPLVHLHDSAAFVSSSDLELVEAVQAMMAEEKENVGALAELILELEGAPRPGSPSAHMAELHYLELHFLVPRLLKAKETLLAEYASAKAALAGAGSPRALDVVSRIEGRQRRHVETLRALVERSHSGAAGPATHPA